MRGSSIVMARGNINIIVRDMLKIVIYGEDGYGWMSSDYSGVMFVATNIPINIVNTWWKWSTTRYTPSFRCDVDIDSIGVKSP